ncbi:MAG TPA: GH1 family beta-glucosidase [Catalimonadaceae bacterium]|nr:GH1 family beta-glucosidase [Catalimonadaceae bacterium]
MPVHTQIIPTRDQFPESFAWGVSTAALQTEGAWNEDGKSPSVWDNFSARKGKIHKGHNAKVACDFYHRYQEDAELLRFLGIPNFRFSIAWSRILPNGTGRINDKGMDFYKSLIDTLLEKGITPWPTLYHWDLPQSLEDKGGWTNRDILHWFEDFANTVGIGLGNRGIQNWMVLNEPMVFTGAGYFLGYHAPGKRGFSNFIPAMLHAALCTRIGEEVLRSHQSEITIGSTYSCSFITPKSVREKDLEAAKRADALLNRLFVEPAMGLGFPLDDLPMLKPVEKWMKQGDDSALKANLDFIGVQNYTREVAEACWYVPYLKARLVNARKRGVPHTDMQWEVYPEALYEMLVQFHRYQPEKPVIVTENGAAFPDLYGGSGTVHDPLRVQYLQQHISQVRRAMNDGVPVSGYFVWTLMDNFEWAEGYRPRFGLVYTDFPSQKRIIKDSGRWYSEFLAGASSEEFSQHGILSESGFH